MKRWIYNSETLDKYSVAFLIFDVCIDDEEAAASAQKVAAGSKKSSRSDKTVKYILDRPEIFLRDFGNYIESLGFELLSDPYKSNRHNSISCYFYAKMTKQFDAKEHEIDLVTIFCIRTSDHEFDLEEYKNDIQEQWMRDHASELTGQINQDVKIFRIQLSSNRSYSDYVASCKEKFRQYCEYYSNWKKWPGNAFEEVNDE